MLNLLPRGNKTAANEKEHRHAWRVLENRVVTKGEIEWYCVECGARTIDKVGDPIPEKVRKNGKK